MTERLSAVVRLRSTGDSEGSRRARASLLRQLLASGVVESVAPIHGSRDGERSPSANADTLSVTLSRHRLPALLDFLKNWTLHQPTQRVVVEVEHGNASMRVEYQEVPASGSRPLRDAYPN